MEFIPLSEQAQLEDIAGAEDYQIILKHNTTCPISKGVLQRLQLEVKETPELKRIYVLDLLAHRPISDAIAGKFGVPHQSPQLLLVKGGRCVYHEWGFDISAESAAAAMH